MATPEGGAVWTMRDGTQIRVRDMADSHLLNTIRMLQRNEPRRALVEVLRMSAYIATAPEGAADACSRAVDELSDGTSPAKFWPIYDELMREARRRNLNAAPLGEKQLSEFSVGTEKGDVK